MKVDFNGKYQRKNMQQKVRKTKEKFGFMLMFLFTLGKINLFLKGFKFTNAARVRRPDLDTNFAYYGGCTGFSDIVGLTPPYDAAACFIWCGASKFCGVPLPVGSNWCGKVTTPCPTTSGSETQEYYELFPCCLETDSSLDLVIPQILYNPPGSMKTVINSYQDIFTHDDPGGCVLNSCKLMTAGACGIDLPP